MNLSAKLEQHNKELGVRALCDAGTYDLALAQGFDPSGPRPRIDDAAVLGVAGPVDLVVLAS